MPAEVLDLVAELCARGLPPGLTLRADLRPAALVELAQHDVRWRYDGTAAPRRRLLPALRRRLLPALRRTASAVVVPVGARVWTGPRR